MVSPEIYTWQHFINQVTIGGTINNIFLTAQMHRILSRTDPGHVVGGGANSLGGAHPIYLYIF